MSKHTKLTSAKVGDRAIRQFQTSAGFQLVEVERVRGSRVDVRTCRYGDLICGLRISDLYAACPNGCPAYAGACQNCD